MKLLDEIISSLSGEQSTLTDALMKTKVLLHRLGRKDLAEWVNLEVNGYSDDTPVPEYRVIHALVKGTVTNGVYTYNDHPLPTLHLDEIVRKRFESLEMRDSIAVLEGLARNDKNGLSRPIPLEFNGYLNKALSHGYKVQLARCDIGVGRLAQILTQVRSRLLDFLLELSEKAGNQMTDDDVKRVAQSPETGSMFNHAIFGDNVTILVGDHSRQTVTNQVIRGDFASLEALLQEHKVQPSDIDELRSAIHADAEGEDVRAKRFGSRVRSWMKNMLGKAVDTSWQIEVGIASNLLTDALKAYYGW